MDEETLSFFFFFFIKSETNEGLAEHLFVLQDQRLEQQQGLGLQPSPLGGILLGALQELGVPGANWAKALG